MKRSFFPAALASSLLLGTGLPAAAFTQQTGPAVRALHWIHTQQRSDGSIAGDPSRTEDTVLGLVANHFEVASFGGSGTNPLTYLAANVGTEEAQAGNIASLILAAVSAGADPKAFGGHNLLTDIAATYGAAVPGEYARSADQASIFGDGLAVLAVSGAGQDVPSAALRFLTGHQAADGGWSFDNAGAYGSDTNTTSVVLEALAATDSLDPTILTHALGYLKTQQRPDGGFEFQTSPPPYNASDPNSDGEVIEGLLAVGQDPTGPAWSQAGKNAVTNLLSFQGCDGSFSYPGSGPENLAATTQPLIALGSAHLPLHPLEGTGGNALTTRAPAPAGCTSPATTPTARPTQHPSVPILAQTGQPPLRLPLGAFLLGALLALGGWRLARPPR